MSEKNNSQLHILPCLDSDQMSLARQQELHIPKAVAATLGQSALEALRTGFYVTQMGQKVVWSDAVQLACALHFAGS